MNGFSFFNLAYNANNVYTMRKVTHAVFTLSFEIHFNASNIFMRPNILSSPQHVTVIVLTNVLTATQITG